MKSLQNQIVSKLGDYLNGRLTLSKLEDFVVQKTWNVKDLPEVAKSFELYLSEYTNGDRTLGELESELAKFYENKC